MPKPDPEVLSAFEAVRDHGTKSSRALCYAPWVQLVFSPDGDVTVCCASLSHPLGNIKDHRLPELWNGPGVEAYRHQLADYDFPDGCATCRRDLDAGRRDGLLITEFDAYDLDKDNKWPQKLEFSLSNTCNLACIMCSGKFSSVIRANEGMPPLPKLYGDQFFEDLAPFLPHLRTTSYKGGEPFIEMECRRIWDMLIDGGMNPHCDITTNGSTYNDRVERVLEELPCNISVSVDGVTKETVEAIRRNNHFDKLMENIGRFNAYAQGESGKHRQKRRRWLQLNYTVQRRNWHETADFFLFAEDLGAHVWYTIVQGPEHCSLVTLPIEELRETVVMMERESDRIADRLQVNRTSWFELLRELRGSLQLRETGAAPLVLGDYASPLERAWAHHSRGETEHAIAAAKRVLPEHDVYARAQCFVGGVLTDLGDFETGEIALNAAKLADSTLAEAPLRMAWLRLTQGANQEARAELAAAKRIVAGAATVPGEITTGLLFVEASVELRAGAASAAMGLLERLIASDPHHDGAKQLYTEAKAACS